MKIFSLFLVLGILCSCATPGKVRSAKSLDIEEVNADETTAEAHARILKFTSLYDLHSFFYTKKIILDPQAEPHSHPVLTLNTRYAHSTEKLMSQLLHEELHWWMEMNTHKVEVAMPDFRKAFKNTPKIDGANDPNATYRHLIICWMEYMALEKYFGKDSARKTITHFMKKEKRFPWIYQKVLNDPQKIQDIVGKHKFIPEELFQRITIVR